MRGNAIGKITNKMPTKKIYEKVPAIRKKITQCTVRGRCRRRQRRIRDTMEEHGLPFTLLSDPEKKVLQAYDV